MPTEKHWLWGGIIKTLVKLQCSEPCISSYNMKATMFQQCCKSGSSKIFKFIVGRLYVLLRWAHCSQHMTTYKCNSQSENVLQTIWTNWNNLNQFETIYFQKQGIIVCSISFLRRHSNGTCRRHQQAKTLSKFLKFWIICHD